MADDLLVRLLNSWIAQDKVPDEISIEYGDDSRNSDNNDIIIYCRWVNTNKEKIFGYTSERWDKFLDKYNEYWDARNAA
jgi:hypothetical protein